MGLLAQGERKIQGRIEHLGWRTAGKVRCLWLEMPSGLNQE